ncbi:AcrA/E family efflux transporter MFP subunit [Catenovulum agarivorans DS-2]|uniref:AcrA/E family efflux transporter MFP subunit n=1 Tax=Catenovulum agarivorans DS-2 TaxID=1328313 RepID=W7QJV9_9ALTE|nr:efflux RND transporter periplasmic adaptor subunit [Catenovulum agarivorans]EWH12176.1 AcrA/E family efflux transporter MFP subunit [Catenovulum agarivorans DS-2]
MSKPIQLIFALLILLPACSEPPSEHAPIIRSIAWQKVTLEPIQQVRNLPGNIVPAETAPLSFQVGGKVQAIQVRLGDQVQAGQLLAQLDTSNYQLALQAAQGEVKKAQAHYSERQAEYLRFQQLLEQQLVSKSQFDNAKSQAQTARSSLEVATTQAKIAQKNLADTQLLAPYKGQISKQYVEPSQQVASGQTIFEIEGQHGFEIEVFVPETMIRYIDVGQTFTVTSQVAKDRALNASVIEIASRAENANSFKVILQFNQTHPNLRAGMSVEVEFVYLSSERNNVTGNAVRVPVSAVLAGANQENFVFVFNAQNNRLEKRAVLTENVIENKILITQGLSAGEIIATAGVHFLHDDQQVTLLQNQINIFN